MISDVDIRWWCALNNAYALSDIAAVCDLGLQELNLARKSELRIALRELARLCCSTGADFSDCRSSAELWRRLGREIVSLDLAGDDPSLIRFDLNSERLPPRLRGHFDFVTNAGTSEHIFNQMNCFEVIHDLTKPHGVMVHVVPSAGYETHGFFNYTIKFFWRLAFANEYHCLDLWSSADPAGATAKPDVGDFLDDTHRYFRAIRAHAIHPLVEFPGANARDYYSVNRSLYVFLRKMNDGPFRVPVDMPDD